MGAFIELALGLILIFLFTSLIVTAIQEVVAAIFALRAKALESALKAVLDGKGAASTPEFEKFKANPLIKALYEANGTAPSYIPGRSFALAVMKMAPAAATAGATGVATLDDIKTWAADPASGSIGKIVSSLITEATNDATKLQKSIETWFDETMDRLSGWYKRWTQVTTIVFGFAAAVVFNINTIVVWDALATQPALRAAAADYAATLSKGDNPPDFKEIEKKLADELRFPIGWPTTASGKYDFDAVLSSEKGKKDYGRVPLALLGWLITALAASLGSAFWFDLLKRFVQIRSAGPKPAVMEAGSDITAGAGAAAESVRPALLRDRA